MPIVIVDNESSYTKELVNLFGSHTVRIINYRELSSDAIQSGDTVILTGGHNEPILWHETTFAAEIEIVKQHKGPVIGICLGFELIAHVYGTHLHLLNRRRKGELFLTATGKGAIPIPTRVSVFENHNWSVRTLKRPLIALATSEDGVEILKHRTKPIYGMQFHPEKSSPEGLALLKTILEQVHS